MKLLYALLIFSFFEVKAQVTPVYFKGDKVIPTKYEATSYGIYGKLSSEELWVLKRFDLDDNLIQTGSYKDEKLSIAHGKFVFYSDVESFNSTYHTSFKLKATTRFMAQTGNFVNGLAEGRWVLFFPDGNVMTVQDYKHGVFDGEFITYDKLGRVKTKGDYRDGKREGDWVFDRSGQKVVYEKGILKSNSAGNKNIPKVKEKTLPKASQIEILEPNRPYEHYQSVARFNFVNESNYPSKDVKDFLSEKGQFVNNLEEGEWIRYYPDGNIRSKVNYVKGKMNGECIWLKSNGKILYKGSFINDFKVGIWMEDGQEVYYKKGVPKGRPPKEKDNIKIRHSSTP